MALEGLDETTDAPEEQHARDQAERPEKDALARELFERTRAEVLATLRRPLSTYRVQLNKDFRFEDARALVPYLSALGASDLYASPVLKACPGSNHGYDVVDHTSINPEIGSPEEHAALCHAARDAGMGLLLDVVPNHMGIGALNALWMDVLENGPASVFAKFFDIDWNPVKTELQDKVLLPILGDQYGVVLEKGELKLRFHKGVFTIHYYDHVFPLAPRGYGAVLRVGLEELGKDLGESSEAFIELQSILTAIEHLPRRTTNERPMQVERNREKEVIKRRLCVLAESNHRIQAFIEHNVALFNGNPDDPRSFDRLNALLEACPYRLAHWRVAGEEINYRRFFDINSLAAIRVEDPDVFEEAHALVFQWIREKKITGLRIDHPDGLFDPTAYFLALQERYFVETARTVFAQLRPDAAPDASPDAISEASAETFAQLEPELRARFRVEVGEQPHSPLRKALFVVVEKIQGGKERIPDAWAVHGTVGYRFANAITGLLVDRENEKALTDAYERFTGRTEPFDQLLYEKKKLILSVSMVSEVNGLARELNRISEMNRRSRDFTLNSLRRAIIEFIAHFPVYRTYVDGWRPELDERDVHYLEWTIHKAKEHDPATNVSIFDFLRDILLRRYDEHTDQAQRQVMLRFAMKLQQLTGPVMAKGMEDTVFYIYNRLTALNEVGGEPERFGTPLSTFHLRNQERAEYWPSSLLTSSTHDTKRSEDVRARLCVLSELPGELRLRMRKWARLNRKHRRTVKDRLAPAANDEWLFYQTLLGAWPMGEEISGEQWAEFTRRMREYMAKAIKEAKVHTSWVNADPDYDAAMAHFVEAVMDRSKNRAFLEDARELKRRIEKPGQVNALTQVLLKLASPGTPDVYQGCELWDLSLVDPDNRRPVDYGLRRRLLDELIAKQGDPEALCRELTAGPGGMDDGRAKLWLTYRGLTLRKDRHELFLSGSYLPLDVVGPREKHAVAFAREHQDQAVVAVAPRLTVPLMGAPSGNGPGLSAGLRQTRVVLPAHFAQRTLRDAISGTCFVPEPTEQGFTLDVGALLERFPVALLVTGS